jgi:formylglycine-generating enzyme required for sulfatase activity
VRISNALQVMIHEVTFDQWQACVDDGGCSGYMPNDMGWGRGDRPVINVSAADIAGYINWLNSSLQKAGGKGAWRLPTENEWTYLLRGRSVNVPVKPPSDTALVTGACADCDLKDDENATRPVGKLDANQLGLYDMASNANEWTIDCAMGTEDCTFGVVRGTPMPNSPPSMAYRFRQSTPYATRHFRNGFRLVRTLSREEAN